MCRGRLGLRPGGIVSRRPAPTRSRRASDAAELLQPLVAADLAAVEAVLAVDPAAVRRELERARLGPLLAPGAELLAGGCPDLDAAPADDVEDALAVHGHVA